MAEVKISIEGVPGIGKTTLYNLLTRHYRKIVASKSPDFVKDKEIGNFVVSKIEEILKSKDSKFLTLESPIGEALLLIARVAFKMNKQPKRIKTKIQVSDKSIDTLISHVLPRLLETKYFKNKKEAFNWIKNILDAFYKYPDLTILLKPKDLNKHVTKTSNKKTEQRYLKQIAETYDFLYTKTEFKKRVSTIKIDDKMTAKSVFKKSIKIIDNYLEKL